MIQTYSNHIIRWPCLSIFEAFVSLLWTRMRRITFKEPKFEARAKQNSLPRAPAKLEWGTVLRTSNKQASEHGWAILNCWWQELTIFGKFIDVRHGLYINLQRVYRCIMMYIVTIYMCIYIYIPGEHRNGLMIWHWHWLRLVHTQHILSTLRTYWAPGKGCNSFAVTLIVTNHCEHVAICKMSPSACKNASSANVKGIHRSTSIRFQPFSGNLPSAIQQSASREMASTPTNPNRIPQIRIR